MRQEVCYYSTGLDFKICLRARKVTRAFEKRAPGERERKRAGHDGKGKDRRKASFPIVPPTPAPSIFRLYGTCLHISHNAPYLPPKILHNLCVSFLLGITAVLREIENLLCKERFGGHIRCIVSGDVPVA